MTMSGDPPLGAAPEVPEIPQTATTNGSSSGVHAPVNGHSNGNGVSTTGDPFHLAFHPTEFDGNVPYVAPEAIDDTRLLVLEEGHCLRGHALQACGRPELRADLAHVGTSLHTLVQMVANRLGLTLLPEMAVVAGILTGTPVQARPVQGRNASREIALAWRATSPRDEEFSLLAETLKTAWEEQVLLAWGREGAEF